jgi:hypothetical protein
VLPLKKSRDNPKYFILKLGIFHSELFDAIEKNFEWSGLGCRERNTMAG